jgi:hypothetical protein
MGADTSTGVADVTKHSGWILKKKIAGQHGDMQHYEALPTGL